MRWFDILAQRLATGLSLLLAPVDDWLERSGFAVRQQMETVGVPGSWQQPIVTLACALLLYLVLRRLWGWWRVGAIVVVMAVLAKVYGALPLV